jgi:hypothetical protein
MKPFISITSIGIIVSLFVYSCQDGSKDPAPKQEVPVECRAGINTTLEGVYQYGPEQATANCPEPGAADKARADREAIRAFTEYGTVFCDTANVCDNPMTCKPDISGQKNMGYRKEARPANEGKFKCYVIATLNANVSCHCKR